MNRIVCVGNRLAPRDRSGPLVFDRLQSRDLPEGVEVVDGGVAGLGLLRFLSSVDRAVFVDSVSGVGAPGGVVVRSGREVAMWAPARFGHDAGLPYLLRVLPAVEDRPPREVYLVGIEGRPRPGAVAEAAETAVALATTGRWKRTGEGGPSHDR